MTSVPPQVLFWSLMASIHLLSDDALRGPCPILYAAENTVQQTNGATFAQYRDAWQTNMRFQADRPLQRAIPIRVKVGRIHVQGWQNEKADHPAFAVTLRRTSVWRQAVRPESAGAPAGVAPSGSAEVLREGVSLTALDANSQVAIPMELIAALPSNAPLPRGD